MLLGCQFGARKRQQRGVYSAKNISISEVYLFCVGKTQNLSHRRIMSVHCTSSLIKAEIYSPAEPGAADPPSAELHTGHPSGVWWMFHPLHPEQAQQRE